MERRGFLKALTTLIIANAITDSVTKGVEFVEKKAEPVLYAQGLNAYGMGIEHQINLAEHKPYTLLTEQDIIDVMKELERCSKEQRHYYELPANNFYRF